MRRTLAQKSLIWAFWTLSTLTWSGLSLSLVLGRTTPVTLSRWWLAGLLGILIASFAWRLLVLALLRNGLAGSRSPLATYRLAALTDIPLASMLPLLVLLYLFDDINHYFSTFPLLRWLAIAVPIGAAGVIHEVILSQSVPSWTNAALRSSVLKHFTNQFSRDLLSVALLVGIAVLYLWPVFTGSVPVPADLLAFGPPWGWHTIENLPQVHNPVGSDALWLFYPYAQFRNSIVDQSLFPLWNPYIFSGTPFLAESSNTQLLQPLNFIFALLPPGASISAAMLLYLTLAGVSMFAFLRVIGLQRGPSLIGAATFMLASAIWWLLLTYFLSSTVWLLPLALIGTEITLRGRFRWGTIITSSAVGLALLGNTQIAFYILLAICIYALCGLATGHRTERASFQSLCARVGILALSIMLGIAVAAAQLLPSIELSQISHRAAVTDLTTVNPVPFHRLLTLILPGILGYPPAGTSWGDTNPFETTLYIGIVPLALAVWAGCTHPNRYVTCSVILIAVGVMLAMVWYSSSALSAVIPAYPFFPSLGRALILVKFGGALLAAFGAQALLSQAVASPRKLLLLGVLLVFLISGSGIAFLVHEWPAPTDESYSRAVSALRDSIGWLATVSVAGFGILFAAGRWGKLMRTSSLVFLSAIIILDLAGFGAPLHTYSPKSSIYPSTPATEYLRLNQGERIFRIIGVPYTTFLPNSAMAYGLTDARGYNALYPKRILQFANLVNGESPLPALRPTTPFSGYYSDFHRVDYDAIGDLRLLSLLNVEYIVLDKQYQPTPPLDMSEFELVMEQPGLRGGVLYRNPNVLPRAFIVGSTETVPDSAGAIRRLQDPEFDPARHVVLENSSVLPSYPMPQVSRVEIELYEPERVHVRVESSTPAWLLLTDTYYPGWQVTVNGEDTRIYPADLLFRAVHVPAGISEVGFSYRPASWTWGVRISVAAILAWLVILLLPLRRRITAQYPVWRTIGKTP